MNYNDTYLTLLQADEVYGDKKLKVIKEYGNMCSITDLAIMMGAFISDYHRTAEDDSLKGRTGIYYTKNTFSVSHKHDKVCLISTDGYKLWYDRDINYGAIRPVLELSPDDFFKVLGYSKRGYNNCPEVILGEYPQYAPNDKFQYSLEQDYKDGINIIINRKKSLNIHNKYFEKSKYNEYKWVNGRKYVRIKVNISPYSKIKLSNNLKYSSRDYVWLEVSPIEWLIDVDTNKLISKKGILSGVEYTTDLKEYNGDFLTSEMYKYLNDYMLQDIIENNTLINNKNNSKILTKKHY